MKNILKPIFLCAMLLPSLSIGAPNPRGATLDITIHTSDEDKLAHKQQQLEQSVSELMVAKMALMKQGDGADAEANCQADDKWCCNGNPATCRACCSANYFCKMDPWKFPNIGQEGLCKPR